MLWTLISFEVKRRLKLLSTWVYALILFSAGLFTMLIATGMFKNISAGAGSERVDANSPLMVMTNATVLALLGLFTVAAIFGQAAVQDFLTGTWSIIFTRRLKKSTYVLGRFLGAYVVAALIFSSILVGEAFGALVAQVIDPQYLGPHRLDVYVWPYVVALLPMLFLAGAIFFSLAALTRQMAPVYVGMVVLVLGYLVLSNAMGDVQNREVGALADPFGFIAIDALTRYWTPFERNTLLVPLEGSFLLNRVLWCGGAAVLLFVVARQFRTTVEEQKGRGTAPRDDEADSRTAIPTHTANPTTSGWLATSLRGAWLLARETWRSPVYWAFAVSGLLFVMLAIGSAPQMYGTATLPVTYQVLELAAGSFRLFVIITITFYAGEFVWRERDVGLADIVFATRSPGWVTYASKLLALVLVASSMQAVAGAAALVSQLGRGYFAIDLHQYFMELVFFGALKGVALCVLALTVQVVVNHKYLGHAAMVGYYVFGIILRSLGVEERMLNFGSEPGIEYSDMNGYGHWLGATMTYRAYWMAVSWVMVLVAALFVVRSRDASFRQRVAQARGRMSRPWLVGVAAGLAVAVGVGGFIFNAVHVKQHYVTSKDRERLQADYEKTWKSWQTKAQPRITAAELDFELHPEEAEPRAIAKGTYSLTNRSSEPIAEVMLALPEDQLTVKQLALGNVSQPRQHDQAQGLRIYALDPPLAPGESVPLTFELEFVSTALRHGEPLTAVVGNGTFANNFALPMLGYQEGNELTRDSDRKEYGLQPKERMHDREDQVARQNSYIRQDSAFITLKATVSTVPDQIAVIPGHLEREWTENGRRHFSYVMDQPILNFFSVLSARYEVLRDQWNDVKLEIYFHPSHRANLERMMNGMKDALAYCSESFGPYQHTQARILEFPRYQSFAQSFPNTIPYSEGIGFIARVRDDEPDDIDYPYYVTAHEIAHQWWAHQVVGANVQGATLTSEAMAQYSALMVLKKKYGEKKMRRFLRYELDRYLLGRITERKKELPLSRDENQPYIHYQKASLVMYALQHYVGEDRVNEGLRKYVEAVKFKGPPYTTSKELVAYLRAETPAELQYLIDDMFETITLYDNRVTEAKAKKNDDGTWTVSLKVKAVKYRSDEKGQQTELDFEDLVDVGALDEHGELAHLEQRRVKKGESELQFTMPTKPDKVGIDPLNLLVDRAPDDNVKSPSFD